MARRPRQPKLSCRLVPRPDRCGEQKLAQAYRALVPGAAEVPEQQPPELEAVEHETNDRHLR